jgi:hypothetical protein
MYPENPVATTWIGDVTLVDAGLLTITSGAFTVTEEEVEELAPELSVTVAVTV